MVSRNGVNSANGWAIFRKIVSGDTAPVAKPALAPMAAFDARAAVLTITIRFYRIMAPVSVLL
jgi:hypothetical protein